MKDPILDRFLDRGAAVHEVLQRLQVDRRARTDVDVSGVSFF